jgi:hypothetical protein
MVSNQCLDHDDAEDTMAAGRRLTIDQLKELARDAAARTLEQLRAEIIAIERTFPELALPKRRRAVRQSLKGARNRTREMSEAARKAVSARMKKYWAERRKAQTKVGRKPGG